MSSAASYDEVSGMGAGGSTGKGMASQDSLPVVPAAASSSRDTKATEDAELRELMIRYQQADRDAVEGLVERLSPRLLRFLAGNLNTRGEAEDLLQICWMQVHRSRHTYRPTEPVLPWIFAIARHVRLDGFRRRQRLDSREVLADALPDRGTPPDAERSLMQKQFFDVLDHLPDSQREVVHMLKVTGMSLEEVALATSSTVGAVKQKAHRAYEKLRGILAGEARIARDEVTN